MHPLCCIAPVSFEGEGSSIPSPPPSAAVPFQSRPDSSKIAMAVESDGAPKHLRNSTSNRSLPPFPPPSTNHRKQSFSALQELGLDQILRRSPSHSSNGKPKGSTASEASFRTAQSGQDIHESKENCNSTVTCTVGSNVAGILYKWVNFGKFWRPRWFFLQDGVLSYYKVHGPDKITINREGQKGFRVVGEESIRFLKKRRNVNAEESLERKTSGELHLKVSSIRESKSDDKKFYIFTGTKTLHLRAETRDERAIWLEFLQAAKDLFPKIPFAHGLILPFEEITITTSKLRARLTEEGLSENVVTECEKIMMSEFSSIATWNYPEKTSTIEISSILINH